MRAAPLAFFLDPSIPDDRVRLRDIARITHHHDEAYIGALAVVVALRRAAMGLDWSNRAIAPLLPDSRVRDNLQRAASMTGIGSVASEIGSSGFVAETVPVAFEVARRMDVVGLEAAVNELNELGGDTDTIGSIAGQLWGIVSSHNATHLLSGVPGADKVTSIADRFAEYAVGVSQNLEMSPQFRTVVDHVDTYLASGDFWTLWNYIAGPGADDELPFEGMDEEEVRRFDTLYDIVYMGQPERATSSEHAVGLRGGPELRSLIEAWRASVS